MNTNVKLNMYTASYAANVSHHGYLLTAMLLTLRISNSWLCSYNTLFQIAFRPSSF